jgi:hypothetical protein
VLEDEVEVDEKIENKYRNIVENNTKKLGLKKMGQKGNQEWLDD